MDKETEKLITEADKMQHFIVTEGWKLARALIEKKIADLENVSTMYLEGRTNDEIAKELRERQSVAEIMKKLVEEIEGVALSAKYNTKIVTIEEEIITRFE